MIKNMSALHMEAPYLLRRGPQFQVVPRGSDVGGAPEIHLDDRDRFSRVFAVRSLEPISTRALLTAPTRVRLLSLAASGGLWRRLRPVLSSDGHTVSLRFPGPGPKAEAEKEARALVDDVASFGKEALDALGAISQGVVRVPDDAPPYLELADPPGVRIFPWPAMANRPAPRLALCAVARRTHPGAEYRLPVSAGGQVTQTSAHRHIPDELAPSLRRVGPCVIEARPDELRMIWDVESATSDRLHEGSVFLARLAEHPGVDAHEHDDGSSCCK